MALIVEDGSGLANSNSYCTVPEADTYHENRLHNTAWTGANATQKAAALVWATALLDQHVDWDGQKQNQDNALRWPRAGVYDKDSWMIDDNVIPQDLKDATAEYALFLLEEDRTKEDDMKGFSEIKVGSIALKADKVDTKRPLPVSVWPIISSYGVKHATGMVHLRRG